MVQEPIKNLLKFLISGKNKEFEEQKAPNKISVNKTISKLAFFYEKIRNTLDYGDEHLLRKNTISRILKRRLVDKTSGSDVSRFLINELIRGGYLEDNTIPEDKVLKVSEIIDKYILLQNSLVSRFNNRELKELSIWVNELMACEIEECLVSPYKENAYIQAFYQIVENRIKLRDQKLISKKDLDLQLYIVIVRLLTKSDNSMLAFRLFKMFYPEWKSPTKDVVIDISRKLFFIKQKIDKDLNNPIAKVLKRYLHPYSIYFRILHRTIDENFDNIEGLILDKQALESEVKKICSLEYRNIKAKLRRSVIRSILYIFITKMILAFILEMPFDLYIVGYISYIPLYINIIFPPLLLYLITMSARVPSEENTKKIIQGINEIVYGINSDKIIFEVKKSYQKSTFQINLFKFMYFLTFIISYGIIIKILYEMHFNIISGVLFLLFLSLVSYFGIRIRKLALELVVIPRKESGLGFLLGIFSYPIIRVGQWISEKSSKFNIFIIILDLIIEAPFKTLIEIFDQWSEFIKEKQDEIYRD